ncbi:ABC transporter substrate-binding protein [Granulibacter bethesdensis CGDNIH1]|uniref:ABC transporter substrate-binding protein n=2 Tax=Granulibacter bethesdensis TaxID=364410 RepID=Q0BSN8_GRABC|nr:ABC transporter substrate-binding protein [Granulibacter bethesdensis CGDNIH1]APH51991.1 ABC transporter substrate-binding protein [Granulibacter bethesdensis]APH64681.1 ABC transporter substrate-binding protein [Granulibacter bethesdensis]
MDVRKMHYLKPIKRRSLLQAAGMALPVGLLVRTGWAATEQAIPDAGAHQHASTGSPAFALPEPKKLRVTWNANSVCTVSVPAAAERGIFKKYNLDVELINFGGSTDQLLEAIATGKADAGVGMTLRWLKPLEQGFDVRITSGIHGGCMRLLAPKDSTIRSVADLRGQTIGTSDLAAPDKNFFTILAYQQGVPADSIDWRAYPADLLSVALKKGEVKAISLNDPLAWLIKEREGLVEIATNLTSPYQHSVCCILGIRGSMVRDDRAAARALTAALRESQEWAAAHPAEAAAIYAAHSGKVKAEQVESMLRSHTQHHMPSGQALEQEIITYAAALRDIGVIRSRTDPERFAKQITADVLS